MVDQRDKITLHSNIPDFPPNALRVVQPCYLLSDRLCPDLDQLVCFVDIPDSCLDLPHQLGNQPAVLQTVLGLALRLTHLHRQLGLQAAAHRQPLRGDHHHPLHPRLALRNALAFSDEYTNLERCELSEFTASLLSAWLAACLAMLSPALSRPDCAALLPPHQVTTIIKLSPPLSPQTFLVAAKVWWAHSVCRSGCKVLREY